MAVFDLFRKKNQSSASQDIKQNHVSKEEIYRMIMEQQARRSPSDQFASGSVFDISRQNRDVFIQAIHSGSAFSVRELFIQSYVLFLNHPQVVGFSPAMVKAENNDTDPDTWNADIFNLESGDYAALLYMPVQQNTLSARIIGVIFSDRGDGYYYSMLNIDDNNPSVVMRNKAMLGVERVGEVSGRGFELMNSFLTCMKNDFYREG